MDGVAERSAPGAGRVGAAGGGTLVRIGLAWLLAVGSCAPALALETRNIPTGTFARVHFAGSGTLHLTQGESAHLTAEGTASALDDLTVATREGVLYIETPRQGRPVFIELRVANLDAVAAEGNGRITGNGLRFDTLHLEGDGAVRFELYRLEADELDVQSRGAARFELSGQVGHQVVELNGAGAYLAAVLISNRTTLSVAGASDVRLWADERLDVEVAGSADIRYAGSPRIEQRVTGVASVLHIPQIVI